MFYVYLLPRKRLRLTRLRRQRLITGRRPRVGSGHVSEAFTWFCRKRD
jgi:hypothetical protein